MKNIMTALMGLAVASTTLVASSQTADAHRYHHHGSGGLIAGAIIGGLALGAIGHHHRYYGYGYGDGYGYGYYPRHRYYGGYGYYPRHRFYGGYGGYHRGFRHF